MNKNTSTPNSEPMSSIELLSMIDPVDGSFVPTELTNTQWLEQLPEHIAPKVIKMVTEESEMLANIREFIEAYGYKHFLNGNYETWSTLTEGYDLEAIEAFVEDNGIENIDSFEDAYCGQYGTLQEAVEMLLDIYEAELPDFIVIDYDATWNRNLRHDYTFEGGFLFNRNV